MLAAAKVWYVAKTFPPPKTALENLERSKWKFMWPSGPEPVRRETLVQCRDSGGLGVVDIDLKCQSLLMSWLWHMIDGQERYCNYFTRYYIGRYLGINNNLRPNANLPNAFYQHVVKTYKKFKPPSSKPTHE
jgi:hypothetical protein